MAKKKNKDSEVIKFYPWDEQAFQISEGPVPAIKNMPDFWRKTERFRGNDGEFTLTKEGNHHAQANLGLKHCMPFFDAVTAGYHYVLHCDLYVTKKNGLPDVVWRTNMNPLTIRPTDEIPVPDHHYPVHFSWQMWWGMQLPEGWSVLITHPLNRPDLPFTVVSGIADFDQYISPGNISFHIKEGFEGIIKSGTPIFSIIPIKRAQWTSEVDRSLVEKGKWDQERKKNYFYGYYKKHYRQEKRYE
jgi:hypothetical protein